MSSYAYIMETGKIVIDGPVEKLMRDDDVREFYLGVGHSGGAPGMNGDLRIFPASGIVVTALANTDLGASQAVSWIGERLAR